MKRESKIIRTVLLELLETPYLGDPQRRSGATLLALAVFRQALSGSVAAMKEIADRIEGRVVTGMELAAGVDGLDPSDARARIEILVRNLREEGMPSNLLQLPAVSDKAQ